jgi:hypothetical protein
MITPLVAFQFLFHSLFLKIWLPIGHKNEADLSQANKSSWYICIWVVAQESSMCIPYLLSPEGI